MIRGKFIVDDNDYRIANEIQSTIFGNEFIEAKRKDEFQHTMTVLVYNEEDLAVATGELLLVNHKEVEIKNVAVLTKHQKQGYGDVAVRMLVNKAMIQGFDCIFVKADHRNIEFFKKIGFVTTGNDNNINNYTLYDMKYGTKELKKPCSSAN